MDAADPTGKGGSTNKGDVCQRLLTQHREVLVSCVPQRFQSDFRELLCRLWIAVKVYTHKEQVNSIEYKTFGLDTYHHLLNSFNSESKWISISPTVHSLLAHGWELIALNGDKGMGEYTEGGLKNNNKFLRYYRLHLARKISQTANLEDCISRLWLRSDPGIRESLIKPVCKLCHQADHYTVSCPKNKLETVDNPVTSDEYYLNILLS